MKQIFQIFILLIFSTQLLYSKCTSNGTGGGDWDQSSTWTCSPESSPPTNPSCPDSIIILSSDSIYIDSQTDLITCGPVIIVIYGQVEFKTGTKLKLADGSLFDIKPGGNLYPGGGGGSSNFLEIGGNEVWTAADGAKTGPLTYDSSGALPIELIGFEANINGGRVDLKWVTATEINNDYFTVERSSDALDWEEVLIVTGAGNSNQVKEYYEVDFKPLEGLSYYRLKQTDFDGKFEYFNVVPVKFIKEKSDNGTINLFPNPVGVGQTVRVDFENIYEEELLVVLRDIKGREFYSKIVVNIEDEKLIGMPIVYDVASGIYLVTATSQNQMYSQKLIVK